MAEESTVPGEKSISREPQRSEDEFPPDESEITDDPIQLYLRDINQSQLLDAKDEFHLANMIQAREHLATFQSQEIQLDVPAILTDLAATWEEIIKTAPKLGVDPPDQTEIINEAMLMHEQQLKSEHSYTRAYLDRPLWGSDREWESLAALMLRFYYDVYLLPPGWVRAQLLPLLGEAESVGQLISMVSLPTETEMAESCHIVEENADWATERYVEFNLRLVISIAKRFRGRGIHMMDLIQEGNIGLLKAIQKFDPSKGFRFSTYATWWIKQSISRYILENARTIRIPVHMVEQISKLIKVQHDLVQILGRDPTFSELAVRSGFLSDEDVKAIDAIGGNRELAEPGLLHRWDEAAQKVENVIKMAEEPVSLESPVGDSDNSTLADYIEDEDSEEPIEEVLRSALKETVRQTLDSLNDRQKQVLELRFGLVDGVYHSLASVSEKIGITRERVRQIEASALRRLRDPSRSNPLQKFVDGD